MSKKELTNEGASLDFSGLGIKDSILKVIADLGLSTPTPIQHQAIPAALSGEDIVGIAQTGTGKTFAFGIPMLQRLALVKGRGLVLLPTRELAGQVENSLRSLGGPLGLRTVSLIGGEAINRQLFALRKRPHIIVATPGRLIDHLKRQSVHLDDISVLVLDEADMMFDMGFAPQIEEVLKRVPATRQTLLFSATMPNAVMKLAEKHLRAPIRVEVAPAGTTAELVEQEMYILSRDDRWEQLLSLLPSYQESVLIFVRTKHGASKLAKKLQVSGFKAAEIHSNLSFPQRQAALAGFRSGQHRILVATDVAARGLDINGIQLVLNFDLPDNSEDYVHRIGRTARAGKKGKAISFVAPDQRREIQKIERLIRQTLVVTQLKSAAMPRRLSPERGYQASSTRNSRPLRQVSARPVSAPVKKFVQPPRAINNYDSLGFRKRPEVIDVTATPDYLQTARRSRPETGIVRSGQGNSRPLPVKTTTRPARPLRPFVKNNQRTYSGKVGEITPPIVNPTFEGGNRYAFRRAMYLLKEEAKGRPTTRRPQAAVKAPAAPASAKSTSYSRPRDVGVRASGFKVFKGAEEKRSGSHDSGRPVRPAFKAKTFVPRFKKK